MRVPEINSSLSICLIWLQIWNLHTLVTLDFSFLSNSTFSSWDMAIVIFMPIVPTYGSSGRDTYLYMELFQAF